MSRRFAVPLLAFLSLLVPLAASAEKLAGTSSKFGWHPLWMRNTSAAAVAQELNWAKGGQGQTPSGFADSVVFRRAISATARDTSQAYPSSMFMWPPHFPATGGAVALSDTTLHTPWIALRVRQDTLSYSWTGGTALDTLWFGAQWSPNGVDWISVNGTPTRAFETTNGAADANGLVPVLLGPFGEPCAACDVATAYLGCVPNLAPVNSSYNLNQTMCLCEGYIRFLFVFDGTGQFMPEIAYWANE